MMTGVRLVCVQQASSRVAALHQTKSEVQCYGCNACCTARGGVYAAVRGSRIAHENTPSSMVAQSCGMS